ncbi:aldo/keto reductase [Ktedonospora formicarum]|uniref:Oxidoreductase n=1 Tax=Ktedonospora formicarum TaxID=2778364 RepID=A0A8J3I8Y6_9CHLR|nr:aldo/keto reductase [Ktedonospora formicarum]GHO47629.1 oxidoreductase [Ktedonospora formicarum]
MQYTRLGNTGLVVSRLAFGCMTFGSGEGALGSVYKVDQDSANNLVAQALDAGVNFFNTADAYANGQSEKMLGRALGKRRQEVVIATKVGNRMSEALIDQGLSRQHIITAVQASLQRLGTDYIDVYLVHRLDPYTPLEETLETLNDIVRQGMVRYIGFSNWPTWLAAKAVGLQREHGWAPFRAAEMYYSLLGRDLEYEMIPFAQDAGIGIQVWSPLAGGFLSGKYTQDNPGGNGGRLSGFDLIPFDRDHGYTVVEMLRAMGAKHEVSPAQMALAWLLAQSSVTSVLVGASKSKQLDENLGATELHLNAEELADLGRLTMPQAIYPHWFNQAIYDTQIRDALITPVTHNS